MPTTEEQQAFTRLRADAKRTAANLRGTLTPESVQECSVEFRRKSLFSSEKVRHLVPAGPPVAQGWKLYQHPIEHEERAEEAFWHGVNIDAIFFLCTDGELVVITETMRWASAAQGGIQPETYSVRPLDISTALAEGIPSMLQDYGYEETGNGHIKTTRWLSYQDVPDDPPFSRVATSLTNLSLQR